MSLLVVTRRPSCPEEVVCVLNIDKDFPEDVPSQAKHVKKPTHRFIFPPVGENVIIDGRDPWSLWVEKHGHKSNVVFWSVYES